MNGRGFFGALAVVAVVAIVAGIGIGIYNAGISAGVAEAARQVAASGEPVAVVPGYGYGYGWHGFGWGLFPFGILFWILGIFLVIALVRGAFGGGRRWGGPGGSGGWREERERRLEEWHKAAHDERPPAA